MTYVDIIILRHLRLRPAHGYELRKRVEATTGFVLHNNSMYPALRRFEEAGAVIKTPETHEGRPSRNVYEITEAGRELLHRMLAQLPAAEAGNEMEFMARLGQFALLQPEERIGVLDVRAAAVSAQLEHLRAMVELARADYWSASVTDEMVRRAEAEMAWLGDLRANIGTTEVEGSG